MRMMNVKSVSRVLTNGMYNRRGIIKFVKEFLKARL